MNKDANATCYYCGGAVNALNTAHIVKEAEGLLCYPCWRVLENERAKAEAEDRKYEREHSCRFCRYKRKIIGGAT